MNTRTGENDFYVGNHLLLAAPVCVVLLPPRDETGGRRRRQTALYSTENQWTQAVDYSGERYYCPPTQVKGKRNKSCSFPVYGKGKKEGTFKSPQLGYYYVRFIDEGWKLGIRFSLNEHIFLSLLIARKKCIVYRHRQSEFRTELFQNFTSGFLRKRRPATAVVLVFTP